MRVQGWLEWAVTTTKMGPNDTRRVVWAIGASFFLCVFYMLTIDFRFYLHYEGTVRVRVGADDEDGPK